MKTIKKLTDISTVEGQLIEYDNNDLPKLPLDVEPLPYAEPTEKQKAETCCDLLDGVSILNSPVPRTPLKRRSWWTSSCPA